MFVARSCAAVVQIRRGHFECEYRIWRLWSASETTISFDLPRSQEIELALYNLAGQKAATLAQGRRQAGTYTLRWDGRDDAGIELASGVYLYRLTAGDPVATRKLLLLR